MNIIIHDIIFRVLYCKFPRFQGEDVFELQRRLNGQYIKLKVNGVFTKDTAEAVRQFQQQVQLPITGIVDLTTYKYLCKLGPKKKYKSNEQINEKLGMLDDTYDRVTHSEFDLVPITWKDYKKWTKFFNFSQNNVRYMRYYTGPLTNEQMTDLFQTQINGMHEARPMYCLVFFVYSGKDLVGFLHVNLNPTATISYIVLQQYAGKHIASRMVKQFVDLLAHTTGLGIEQLGAEMKRFNKASRKVLLKNGFVKGDGGKPEEHIDFYWRSL